MVSQGWRVVLVRDLCEATVSVVMARREEMKLVARAEEKFPWRSLLAVRRK